MFVKDMPRFFCCLFPKQMTGLLERAKELRDGTAVTHKAQSDAPNYHRVGNASLQRCGTCRHFADSGRCDLYEFNADAMYTCDSWRPDIERLKKARVETVSGVALKHLPGQHDQQAHGSGGGERPRWAGDKTSEHDGLKVYNGKFGNTKDKWAADDNGSPTGWRNTPQETVADYRKLKKQGDEGKRSATRANEALEALKRGEFSPELVSRYVQSDLVTTRAATAVAREWGLNVQQSKKVVGSLRLMRETSMGAFLYDPEELIKKLQRFSTKEVSSTPTAVYAHGPGGLFSPAGLGDTVAAGRKRKKRKPARDGELFNAMITTKPGDKYRSIKNPKVYEALLAKGMPKSRAAAISNAIVNRGKGKRKKETAVTIKAVPHGDTETASFTVTANPETMERFKRFLAQAAHNAAVGHSSMFGFEVDGDGSDFFVVRGFDLSQYDEDLKNAPTGDIEYPSANGGYAARTTKTQANNIRNIVEAKIHRAYTTALDELFLRGYMERDERLAVAGMIGDLLREFGEKLDSTIGKRPVAADAVAWVASERETAATPLEYAIQLKHVSHDQKAHGARHGVQGLREFAKKRGYTVTDRGENHKGKYRYEIRGGRGGRDNMRANNLTSAKKLMSGSNKRNIQADREQAKRKRGGFEVGQVVMPKQGNSIGSNHAFRGRIVRFEGGNIIYRPLNARPGSFADNEFAIPINEAMASNKEYDPLAHAIALKHASHNFRFGATPSLERARRYRKARVPSEYTKRASKEQKTQPPTFTVFKDKTGRYRWVAISSTAYRDRDGEIVSTKALADDVAHADTTGEYGTLRWWHVPGLDLGDCDFNMLYGRSLIESGTFKNDRIAERVKEKAHLLKLSLGFRHPADEPDKSGVFHTIRRFERSLIPPEGNASNLFTRLSVV